MNNRQTSFGSNEWNRQKTNIPLAQYSPNVASTYSMRPPYGPIKSFNNEHTKSNKTDHSTHNLQFHEPPVHQTSSTTVNFPPNQNAIYPPRLTHRTSTPSHQLMPNFQIPQNLHGMRHGTQTSATFPASNQFSKIPYNMESVQSFQRNNNAYSPVSNASNNVPSHMQSSNQNNISSQYDAYRNPPSNQIEMISSPNSNNIRQHLPSVSNMPEFIRHPPTPNSDKYNCIKPELAPSMPDFRPSLPQGFNKSDIVRRVPPPVSTSLDFIRQPLLPGSGSSNIVRQPTPIGSSNPAFMRQPSLPDSSNSDFIRQSYLPGSNNPDFIRQLSQSGSSNPDFIRQHPPSDSCNPDFIRQPIPSSSSTSDSIRQPSPISIGQHPPILPSSNIYASSGHLPYSSQMPPVLQSGVAPSFTTFKQDSLFNVSYGPDITMPPPTVNSDWGEENKLNKFMERFTQSKKSISKADLTVTEFRNRLRDAFSIVKKLMELKTSLLNEENEWNRKLKEVLHYKDQLTKECDFLSEPKVLNWIQGRLKSRKRKRELKKKIRLNRIKENAKKRVNREELHQTIDKWLESINEKNLKLKRETEMKKEADSILAEVRRKIHEAKRTIDKIKVFEKLRSARHENAVKKGLFRPDQDKRFQTRISELKSTLFKQLSDYESEEKALKVMLEAEQEGQLEEEALWRIRQLKTSQQRRKKNILESLFGNEEDPTEEDPIFLFNQYQSSGHKSIENLVQIRHHWDLHLNKDGEAVPSQWVVPVQPSSAAWDITIQK